jgi:hypothetical protein
MTHQNFIPTSPHSDPTISSPQNFHYPTDFQQLFSRSERFRGKQGSAPPYFLHFSEESYTPSEFNESATH